MTPISSEKPDAAANTLRDLTTGSAGTLILLLLVFACYAWSSQSDYVWDDEANVVGNATLRSFAGLSRIWIEPGATPQYYPLTYTSFWLEARVFGLSPKLSHVINAGLHALGTLLLWKILARLAVPGAWAAAAVFAVHPIQVESVAWISERKNTLSLLLGLSALLMYLRAARIGHEPRTVPAGEGFNVPMPDDPTRLYRLFLAMFVLALLAKTTLAVLPAVVLVIVWWQRGRIDKADARLLLPAFAISALAAGVTVYLDRSPAYVGANGVEWDATALQRVQLVGQTAAFYAYKILWPFPIGYSPSAGTAIWPPFPISFNYARWTPDPASVPQWLPLAVVLACVAALFAFRGRVSRGPLAAALVFLIGIAPACGLVIVQPMRYSWVADHFAYVGSIGLIVGVVAGAALVLSRRPRVAGWLTAALLTGLAAVTFWHATAFKNGRALWFRTHQANRQSWLAAVNYGDLAIQLAQQNYVRDMRLGDEEKAVDDRNEGWRKGRLWIERALAINPRSYDAHTSLAGWRSPRASWTNRSGTSATPSTRPRN